jgi:hypothetical protein
MGLIFLIEQKNARETHETAFFTSHAAEPSPKPTNHGTNIGRRRLPTPRITTPTHRIDSHRPRVDGDGAIAASGALWVMLRHPQHHASCQFTSIMLVLWWL